MWWGSLNLAQQIYFCIACAATVLLIVQIVLMAIGLGSHTDINTDSIDVDTDVDVGTDFDSDSSDAVVDTDVSFNLFTVRGLIAFFSIGGWLGYALADWNLPLAIIFSIIAGSIALVLMALVMKWIMSLQSSGNLNYNDAVGLEGEVYLPIPPKDQGVGKVNVTLNERYIEHLAIQNGEETLKTGTRIKVIKVFGDKFIVEEIK